MSADRLSVSHVKCNAMINAMIDAYTNVIQSTQLLVSIVVVIIIIETIFALGLNMNPESATRSTSWTKFSHGILASYSSHMQNLCTFF